MQISELFYRLSVGELSNLAMGMDGAGAIRAQDQGKLVVYLNSALKTIHKRFVLVTKEVLIEPVDHITNYPLKLKYALSSNSNENYKFIIDSKRQPFNEDVIRILEVWDSLRNQLPLNDPGDPRSVFTPSPDTLQVPEPINRNALSIIYQADHVKLDFVGLSSEKALAQDIVLPSFLEDALINHMAYKVYSHLNGQEHMAKSQEYLTMYESLCVDIETSDLVNQSQSVTHTKLEKRGFV